MISFKVNFPFLLQQYFQQYQHEHDPALFENRYTEILKRFAKENNCIVDPEVPHKVYCTEADYIVLKLKHPLAISDRNSYD